jgi:hypothetical protein
LTVDRDSLADLPADSRREIVAEVCAVLDVEAAIAEDLVRSAEPFWDAMERAGGLVDSWGGGEFCHIFPRVLAFARSGCGWRFSGIGVGALTYLVSGGRRRLVDRRAGTSQFLSFVTAARTACPCLSFLSKTPVTMLAAHVASTCMLSLASPKAHVITIRPLRPRSRGSRHVRAGPCFRESTHPCYRGPLPPK